jgi:hypothetical protein
MQRAGFTTEQDGSVVRGVRSGQQIDAHVRTLRRPVYAFWTKKSFGLAPNRFGALVLLRDGHPPAAYLVPALAWRTPDALVVSRDYDGLASEPEWGLNLSGRTLPLLDEYRISRTLNLHDSGHPRMHEAEVAERARLRERQPVGRERRRREAGVAVLRPVGRASALREGVCGRDQQLGCRLN